MTTQTITTTPAKAKSATKREAFILKLRALGLSDAEVSEALALLAPGERKTHTAGTLPLNRLSGTARAIVAGMEATASGLLTEGYGKADLMSKAELTTSNRFAEDTDIATVAERLGSAIASGDLPKATVTKRGKTVPSSGIKALRSIRAALAWTDA